MNGDRCPERNSAGQQCRLTADHPFALDHDYPLPRDERVAALTAERDAALRRLCDAMTERDAARRELASGRAMLAMEAKHADEHAEQKSSAFWRAAWLEANRLNNELALELAKRDRRIDEVAIEAQALRARKP